MSIALYSSHTCSKLSGVDDEDAQTDKLLSISTNVSLSCIFLPLLRLSLRLTSDNSQTFPLKELHINVSILDHQVVALFLKDAYRQNVKVLLCH